MLPAEDHLVELLLFEVEEEEYILIESSGPRKRKRRVLRICVDVIGCIGEVWHEWCMLRKESVSLKVEMN